MSVKINIPAEEWVNLKNTEGVTGNSISIQRTSVNPSLLWKGNTPPEDKSGRVIGDGFSGIVDVDLTIEEGVWVSPYKDESSSVVVAPPTIDEPVKSYVYRLDGLTQYYQFSSGLSISSGSTVSFKVKGVKSIGARVSLIKGDSDIYIHGNGNIYCRDGGGSTAGVISVDGDGFSNNPPFIFDGEEHEISVKMYRVAEFLYLGTDFDAGLNPRYLLSGSIYELMVTEGDLKTTHLPLTNKAQGAVQLPTVGGVSATIINYTDSWEEV